MRRAAVLLAFSLAAWNAAAGVPDWLKSAAAAPIPSYPGDVRGVALLDEISVTVLPSGEIRKLTRRAYRVLGTAGRDLGYVAVHFDSDTRLTALRAWSITAKGEEYQVKERDASETSAFDGELYADNKIKVLRIPAAEPGNTIGYEYEQTGRSYGLEDVWQYQSDVPVRRARYTLTLPEGWTQQARWFHATAAEPRMEGKSLAWDLTDVPAIEVEPQMPAMEAIAARMAVRFDPGGVAPLAHRTWDDVARWYEGLSAPRRASSPALQSKARELTASAKTLIEKVAALAHFAQNDVRYVAIEIGIGGFQPHAAQDILTSRYGDCKDKVTVLAAMLHEVGIESYYVLINTERGVVDAGFPSHAWFNHAIIAIPLPEDAAKGLQATIVHPKLGRLLIFDPTSTSTAFGSLPPYLQQNHGFLVTPAGGAIIELPSHPALMNKLARTARLTLRPDGGIEGDVREVMTGSVAAPMRATLRELGDGARRQYLETRLTQHLPQSTLGDPVVENLEDVSKELIVRYHISAPTYARNAAGMLLVRPRVIGQKVEGIRDLAKRKNAYVTSGPELHVDDFEIVVPAGLSADELPPPRDITSGTVRYTSSTTFEGSTLHYRRELTTQGFEVALADLPALNRTYTDILSDERAAAVLVKK
ncbi:MAG: hypothetical protein QOH21_2149 [Acidobacteriota bacterium]|jgi:transglutaminase-like putative cysteine protease|nr:hypothetical protein [Acidobacteriota bacterium]